MHDRLRGAAVLWIVGAAILTIPAATVTITNWLDGSWQVALSLAPSLRLPIGSRLLFPYGPYGYLDVLAPVITPAWYQAVAANLTVHVALIATIAVLLFRWQARLPVWLAAAAALSLALPAIPGIDEKASLLAVLLAFLACDVRSRRWSALTGALCGATLAIVVLVKLTGFPLAAGVLLITLVALTLRRSWLPAVALTATFGVMLTALWLAAGLGVGDVVRYVHAGVQFGGGYSGAMYIGGFTPLVAAGAAVVVVVAAAGVWLLLRRRGTEATWLLLVATALFPLFKDNLVRDVAAREAAYFGVVALVLAMSLGMFARGTRAWGARATAAAIFGLSGALVFGLLWPSGEGSALSLVGTRLASYGTVVQSLTSPAHDGAAQAARGRAADDHRALIAALAALPPGATVDVMPWDIGLVFGDPSLHWDPRPVLASYAAYTQWLDEQDAAFLSGAGAPDYVVYTNIAIDDRYASFDEPITFRVLLEHYRVVRTLPEAAVLLQRLATTQAEAESNMGTTCVAMGASVAMPPRPGARVYANIAATQTPAGRLLDVLAKSGEVRITLTAGSGHTERRLVPAAAADGLFVSTYIDTTPDIAAAFSGAGGVPLTALTVRSEAWAWSTQYCVTFLSTPATG